MGTPNTYSFLNVICVCDGGDGSSITLGNGSGAAKEGITVSMMEEKATMVTGADGTPMHSLHASKGGTITVRLLKTSPTNALLSSLYNFTTSSSANYGQDTISVRDPVRGDSVTASQCGLRKLPDVVYSEDGPMNEWVWNAGVINTVLGNGTPG